MSTRGAGVCTPCPVNTFKNTRGSGVCVACPSGLYNDGMNHSCTACQAGEDHCPWSSGLDTHFSAASCTDVCDTQPRCAFAVFQPAPRNRCLTWTALGLQRARAVADPAVAATFRRCFPVSTVHGSCAACPSVMGSSYAHALTGMHGWVQIKHLPAGSPAWFAGGTFAGAAASGAVQVGSPADASREWAVPFDAVAARFFLFVCRDSERAAAAPDVWAVTRAADSSGHVFRAADNPDGLAAHALWGQAQIPAHKIRNGALFAQTGEYSPLPFEQHHLLYAEGGSAAEAGPPPVTCAVYVKSSRNTAAGPECSAGYAVQVGPGPMRVVFEPVHRERLADALAVPLRFTHSLATAGGVSGASGRYSTQMSPETLFFARQPASYVRTPFLAPGFNAQSGFLTMLTTARDVLEGRDAFSAGVLHRNTHAGPSCCPDGGKTPEAGEASTSLHSQPGPATGDFTALALAVVPGYVGPGGAGFVQRLPLAVTGAPFTVESALRLGGAPSFTGGHMIMFTTAELLRTAPAAPAAADWQWIVCAQKTGTDSVQQICEEQPDPDGGERNRRNALLLDGIVVPLGTAGDCCSPLRPAVPVAQLENTMPFDGAARNTSSAVRARVALLEHSAAHLALWARGGGLHAQHTPLCFPGLATMVFSNSSAAAAAVFPCRWPAGAESPFPAVPAAGAAAATLGPWFFDRVFVVSKGWVLVCIEELPGSLRYRIAEAARVAPARPAWNYNVPNDALLFREGTMLYAGAGPVGRCAAVETCPAAGAYTAVPGHLAWAPRNASAARWLYVVFTAGPSAACAAHNCDEGAAYAQAEHGAVHSAAAQTLLIFPGTRVEARILPADSGGQRRQAPTTRGRAPDKSGHGGVPRRRSLQMQMLVPASMPQRPRRAVLAVTPSAHGGAARRPRSTAGLPADAGGNTVARRALLTVAAPPPDSPVQTMATREIVGLDNSAQIARAVCARGAACQMVVVTLELVGASYCLPEDALIRQTETVLGPVMLRAGGGSVSSTRITSVSRVGLQAACAPRHSEGRRLLRVLDAADFSVVLGGTAGPMSIHIDVDGMSAAGIRGIVSAESGSDSSRVRVSVCAGGDCKLPAAPRAAAAVPARTAHAAVPVLDPASAAPQHSLAAAIPDNASAASPKTSDDTPTWVWLAVAGFGVCMPVVVAVLCCCARRGDKYTALCSTAPCGGPAFTVPAPPAATHYAYPEYPHDYYPQQW